MIINFNELSFRNKVTEPKQINLDDGKYMSEFFWMASFKIVHLRMARQFLHTDIWRQF